MDAIDPTICPLCGSANMCAMEIAKATGKPLERCWCVDAVFDPQLLESLPEDTKGKACICSACSNQFQTLSK
jgi:hypothetical protein